MVGFIQAQWLPVNISLAGTPPSTDISIYGDEEMAIVSTGLNFVFKSFDNGRVWIVDWFEPFPRPKKIAGSNEGHIMFVETNLKGYYYSTNRGGSWEKVNPGLSTVETILDIEAGRDNLFFIALSKDIYRKSPSNNALEKITPFLPVNEKITGLATFKTSGEMFFASSTGKIRGSSYEGTSWIEVANFNKSISILETFGDSNVVVIGGMDSQRTLYFSSDTGRSWDSLPLPIQFLELHMTTPARGFAKSVTNDLYYTTDSMKTWTKHSSLKLLRGCKTSGENGILITPAYDVYTSSNSGESWEQISDLNTNLIKDIEILPGNSAFALTASGELHFSGDFGSTWHLVKDSLPSPMTKLTKDTDTSFLAYSPGGPVIRYSNSSGKFTNLTQLCPNFSSPIYNYNGTLYVAKDSQDVSFSTDFGLTWTTRSIPDTAKVNFFFATDSLFYIASDEGNYYASTNRGNTWVRKWLSPEPGDKLLFIYRNGNRMWACSKSNQMFLSESGGVHWIRVNDGNISKAFYLHKYMWVMQQTPSKIIQSTNEGRTWELTQSYPSSFDIANIKINPPDFGLMLRVNGSLFRMHNGGLPVEMTSFNADVVSKGVLLRWETATETNNYGFFVQRKNNGIWSDLAFISGMGTTLNPSSYSFLDELRPDKGDTNYYRLKQVDFSGEFSYSKEVAIGFTPYTLELDQNYPNPFSTGSDDGTSETVIRFRLPEDGETKLTVYDTQGRVVEELLNGALPAGEHSFTFPSKGGSPASGVYFYELRFNGKIKRGKMLLLR
ncbi:MAG: T9SS type A sorting domain-containing protein [Ignavibacteriales bacterium]|nr:T9SS type A sorting domain-containing protein [Ignavibacteriales bacterium]